MDLGNPVLELCQDGMRAEAEGRSADAQALFEQAFCPSLHVGVAMACERLGDIAAARAAFERAAEHVGALPADGYGEQLRTVITDSLRRLSVTPQSPQSS